MKHILLALFILFPILLRAQAIPNGTFETWVPDSNSSDPNAEVPGTWLAVGFGGGFTKVSPGQGGSFAVGIKGGDLFGTPFPSFLIQQIPTTTISRYLNGYVRKTSGLGDTLNVTCVYSQNGNGTAAGSQTKRTVAAQWTPFSIEIFNFGSASADTISILIQVNGAGSGYELDNLTLSNTSIGGPLGTKASLKSMGLTATLSPNPISGDQATVTVNKLVGASQVTVRVVDMLGKTVWFSSKAVSKASESLTIGTGALNKGMYHIVVENAGRRFVLPFVKN